MTNHGVSYSIKSIQWLMRPCRGASSTLMQEIAQGCVSRYTSWQHLPTASLTLLEPSTCESCCSVRSLAPFSSRDSQNFNEIMPAIYARFMEKEARQWRQIYKVWTNSAPTQASLIRYLQALQLLEYLIKNGSERVVDDARSHVGTIKMLRNFYYVDEKGKDQGINGAYCCLCSSQHVYNVYQSGIGQKSLWSCWAMWTKSVVSGARRRRTSTNILVLATTL